MRFVNEKNIEAHQEIRVPYDCVIKQNNFFIIISTYLIIYIRINFYWGRYLGRYMTGGSVMYLPTSPSGEVLGGVHDGTLLFLIFTRIWVFCFAWLRITFWLPFWSPPDIWEVSSSVGFQSEQLTQEVHLNSFACPFKNQIYSDYLDAAKFRVIANYSNINSLIKIGLRDTWNIFGFIDIVFK